MASFADRFRKGGKDGGNVPAEKKTAAGTGSGESVPAAGTHPAAGTPQPKMVARSGPLSADEAAGTDAETDERALLRKLGLLPPEGVNRKLGETTPDVPYVFPSPQDSGYRKTLKAALLAEETRLGIWINPDDRSAEAWIAVQVQDDPNLLLLHRLPLLNRSAAPQDPF